MKYLLKIFCRILALFFGSTILAVVVLKFVPVYFTPLMFTRLYDQVKNDQELALHHTWVPLSEMSKNLPIAVMAGEDARFMQHHGFDFEEIEKAIKQAERRGKKSRGASTISQQTAKNVFLWQGRSWVRKGLEAYFTVLIETIWGKERIMEVYLNSIEMGHGIYGVQAVAENNFNKNASDITRNEAALIAATLPNPLKYSSKNPSSYMRKRQSWIRNNMRYVETPEWLKKENNK